MLGAIMPVAVMWVTGIVKNVQPIPQQTNRVLWVRAVVAVLAVIGAILTQIAGGDVLNPGLVETAVLALFNAGAATWLYTSRK